MIKSVIFNPRENTMIKIINKVKTQQLCGESPVRIPETGKLIFTDTGNPLCRSWDPAAGEMADIKVAGNYHGIARTASGGWIATTEDRILLCDSELSIIKELVNPYAGDENICLGDGTVGPDGCFYFGAFRTDDLYSKDGAILRVNADHSVEKVLSDLALPNGMAFTDDGSKYYITEMFGSCIWVYHFDKDSGSFSNKKLFTEIPEADGFPDGLIIDADGYIYSAHWAGFRITRYSPEGSVDRVIEMPVPTPTCMAFGGKDMSELHVTTARKGLTDEELEKYPDSGDFFILQTDFTGRDELIFRG